MKEDAGSPVMEDGIPVGKCLHESGFHPPMKGDRAPSPRVIKEVIQHLGDGAL